MAAVTICSDFGAPKNKFVKKIVSLIKIATSITSSSGAGIEGGWEAVLGKQKLCQKC